MSSSVGVLVANRMIRSGPWVWSMSDGFLVTTHIGGADELLVADVWLAEESEWDVDLAEVVKVNALAVPTTRSLTHRVMRHELHLLLSFYRTNLRLQFLCGTASSKRVRVTSRGL